MKSRTGAPRDPLKSRIPCGRFDFRVSFLCFFSKIKDLLAFPVLTNDHPLPAAANCSLIAFFLIGSSQGRVWMALQKFALTTN